jgi:hypothetical protein
MAKEKVKLFWAFFVSAILLNSCVTEEPNGKWYAMKVNKDSWSVSGAGADITVELLNYPSWWIEDAYIDKEDYDNYIWPSSSGDKYESDILDGGWFYATVPHDGNGPRLEVWVGANEGSQERETHIVMSCGDVSKTIHIHQGIKAL